MSITVFRNTDVPRVQNDISTSIVSGTPEHFAELMFNKDDGKVRCGIWESTAGVFNANYDGIVEFCHVLEGEARIKTADGNEFHVKTGDGFVLNEGLQTEWTVDKFIKKHFMICSV